MSTRVATSTVSREPLTAEEVAAVRRRGLVASAWATPASGEDGRRILTVRNGAEATGCGALVARDAAEATGATGLGEVDGSTHEPERNFERWGGVNTHPPAGKGKRPHLVIPRAEYINNPTIHQILRPRASAPSSNATILISYFGLCTYTPETLWRCTSRRTAANSSSLLPPPLHALSKALQKTLSPIPPIITIICLGLLLLTTITLAFVPPLSGIRWVILERVYLGVGLLTVVTGVFSAVLFYQSGLVAFAVLDSLHEGKPSGVSVRKGGSGIAVAWAAVFFEAVGALGVVWLVLYGPGEAGTDEDGDGGSTPLSIFSRVFGGKKDEQGQELGEGVGRGSNSPTFPQNVHPALRSGDITIGAPLEVRRDVHPLRGNFQPENHLPSRRADREVERVLSVGSVSTVSALSDRGSIRGADGGRQGSAISAVSDMTTVREAGSAGRGRLESERVRNMRRGNAPFPGGWNMI